MFCSTMTWKKSLLFITLVSWTKFLCGDQERVLPRANVLQDTYVDDVEFICKECKKQEPLVPETTSYTRMTKNMF